MPQSSVFHHFLSSIYTHSLGELIWFLNTIMLSIYQWLQYLSTVQIFLLNSRHIPPTVYWISKWRRQIDILKLPFQTELLISSHSTTHVSFHLSFWQHHPSGSYLGPKSWSYLYSLLSYSTFNLSGNSVDSMLRIYTYSSHFLLPPVVTLVWAHVISHLIYCSSLRIGVLTSIFALVNIGNRLILWNIRSRHFSASVVFISC